MPDEGRKAHVIRIYQNDDQTSEIWLDVERIDQLIFDTGSGLTYQKYIFQYDRSLFDPDDPDKAEKKEIKNPDDDTITIKVPVRRAVTLDTGAGLTYQKATHDYANDPDNTTRITHIRIVDHYDIPDSALDAKRQPPRDPTDYINAVKLDSKDDSGKPFKVEVIQEFINTTGYGFTWQKHIWRIDSLSDKLLQFGNKDWVQLFGVDKSDTDKVDPPWRLDPLQNIVNVNWGGGLAVEFGDGRQAHQIHKINQIDHGCDQI